MHRKIDEKQGHFEIEVLMFLDSNLEKFCFLT